LLAVFAVVGSAVYPSWGVTNSTVSEIVLPAIFGFYLTSSFFYGIAAGLTYLWQSRTKVHTKATRRKWILRGVALALIIIVVARSPRSKSIPIKADEVLDQMNCLKNFDEAVESGKIESRTRRIKFGQRLIRLIKTKMPDQI
jgi:uncharacterized membrane protein